MNFPTIAVIAELSGQRDYTVADLSAPNLTFPEFSGLDL